MSDLETRDPRDPTFKASARVNDDHQTSNSGESGSSEPAAQCDREMFLRNKRKCFKARMTRGINRLLEGIRDHQSVKRLKKQMNEIHSDYDKATECHSELYGFVDDSQTNKLDQWEGDIVNLLYEIEDELDNYIQSLRGIPNESQQDVAPSATTANRSEKSTVTSEVVTRSMTRNQGVSRAPGGNKEHSELPPIHSQQNPDSVHREFSTNVSQPLDAFPQRQEEDDNVVFDNWIDQLVEFQETKLPIQLGNLSIADALYRLEASRDLPSLEIPKFDGDPLKYVEFIEMFRIQVHERSHLNDDVRMAQLRSHVIGDVERAISGLGSGGKMYGTALKLLKEQFGQRSFIARAFINKLIKGNQIHPNDKHGLRELSLDVINALATFTRMNYLSDLNASETLRQIVNRLPDHLLHKWKALATSIRESGEQPSITHISEFLKKMVKTEYNPDFGDLERGQRPHSKGSKTKLRGIHITQSSQTRRPLECFICREPHRVSQCPTFTDSCVDDRVKMVKDNRLCFSFLTKGHQTRVCRVKKKCDTSGCNRVHHPLLHPPASSVSGTTPTLDKESILPVVRVVFRSINGRTFEGNVLVDSGAGTTIIRKAFAKQLGLQGRRESLSLAVVGGETLQQSHSRRVKCWLSPIDGGEEHQIEAHEIDQTTLSVPPLDRDWLKSFPHLSDINFHHKAGPVDLILGVQYSHLHAERQVRQGLPFEPLARRSLLGWYVMGPCSRDRSAQISVSLVQRINLQTFYDFETLGIQALDCKCPKPTISLEERAALEQMAKSCHRAADRYTIGLPFKQDPDQLPNNYPMAMRRLVSLETSLLKNPAKARIYSETIGQYEAKGWSCPLTESEMQSDIKPVNYLPNHGVYRPDKVSTPLRIVFDPASRYQGTCLNAILHKGPGLNGNLFGVLLRFREEEIGFTGDISKMFLQIKLPERDTHLHRYLWRDLNIEREPTVCRLLRVTFGDKSSPDMAGFVMKRIADEVKEHLPEASTILDRDRYVDDIIHSCSSPDSALERIGQIEIALGTGSFQIKEWFVSSPEVRQQLKGDAPYSDSGRVSLDHQEDVKTLGLHWDPDLLKFAVKPVELQKPTKRKILSRMSMLYDPLGLASCVTIKARVAMQDIWKTNQYGWDDILPPETCELWTNLLNEIDELKGVEFPRCLKPADAQGKPSMHLFSDASATAYGAIAYLMWSTPNGPHINIISAKARVAPLRQTTIPRLELMAALVASRLAKTVFDEFKVKPETVTLWTDSQIVLQWL